MKTTDIKLSLVVIPLAIAFWLTGCNKFEQPPNMARALALREVIGGGAVAKSNAGEEGPTAEPTGWASFKGRITLVGSPPPQAKLPVTGADASVCAPGGKPVFGQTVVVGENGGIKNVIIFLTTKISPDEPWTHPSVKPGTPKDVVFDQKQCTFLTHVCVMQTGQTLRILNSDLVGHNTKIDNTPINRIVASGGEVIYRPQDEWKSPTPVSCSIHPWMSAHLLVRENGYFAVTDENGDFEIPNLPAGVDLVFRIWQEKTKFLSGVEIDGQAVKKGKITLNLPAEGKELQVALDSSLFQ